MKTEAYLGLDLGGTGVKAGVFDCSGALLGFGHRSYAPNVSKQGHVEIPIDEIYTAARDAVRQAVRASNARVLAMAISSQGQTFVTLDKNDKPLHPAIVWYDSRAKKQAERLRQAIHGKSDRMLLIEAIATAPKIMWLREHFPKMMRNARRYLLLPDYLTYRLTGQAITDPNTASSTALFAEDAPTYDSAVLAAANIEERQLAGILPCGSPVANVSSRIADEWGLSSETIVVTGTNDQYAGALGAGNCRPGILTETTGTCLSLVTLTERLPEPLPSGLLGGRFPIKQYQFALAYSKTAGVVLDWFRHELCKGESFDELSDMATRVPIGSYGLTVIPHFDGMISPFPGPDVRGMFAGLTLQHTRADIFRAILESLTFSLYENIGFLKQHVHVIDIVRTIGGGAKNDFWLQMKADVIGMQIEKPVVTEAAVLGAAMLSALGHGEFSSLAESSEAFYRKSCVFDPNPANHQAYTEPYRRYQDMVKTLIHGL